MHSVISRGFITEWFNLSYTKLTVVGANYSVSFYKTHINSLLAAQGTAACERACKNRVVLGLLGRVLFAIMYLIQITFLSSFIDTDRPQICMDKVEECLVLVMTTIKLWFPPSLHWEYEEICILPIVLLCVWTDNLIYLFSLKNLHSAPHRAATGGRGKGNPFSTCLRN